MSKALAPRPHTWEATISLGEFAAAHPNPNESPPANWGRYTLMFKANGRFESRNSRFPGQRSGLGTYAVDGDVIILVPAGTASMGAGEIWRYSWTSTGTH